MAQINKITVFGAGTMGHGIAQQAAATGFQVTLTDVDASMLDKGRQMMLASLEFMAKVKRVNPASIPEIMGRVTFSADLDQCAREADFVFEAVFENLELKQTLFKKLGELTRPDVILASNTSSFDISLLASVTRNPERVIGTHWFHPPQITPALEVIPTDKTSPEVLSAVLKLANRLGKYATRCSNVPGFVANRIQFAMLAEVMAVIEEGVATPEEVDRIVKSSIGFRLACFGPCEIADQAGVDVYRSIYESLTRATGREVFKTPPLIEKMAAEGKHGLKTKGGFYDYSAPGKTDDVLERRNKLLLSQLGLFEKASESDS
jgi:3-hydroxybutyryl-CoA dehydrogenase